MNQELANSDFSLRSENNEDYISKLPYDVLERILKIHPLDSGLKTMAILTGLCNRHNFVYNILRYFANVNENDTLKTQRKLDYDFSQGFIITAIIELDKKQLNLDFSMVNQEFPPHFRSGIVPRHLRYVNTLNLTSIKDLNENFVTSIISNCSFVEHLIIDRSNGLRSLRMERFHMLTSISVQDYVDLELVYVDSLVLNSLRLHGNLCWFSLKTRTLLEDVKLDSEGPMLIKHLNHRLFNPLLNAIRCVKVLTLHGWMFKEIFGPLLFTKHNEHHFRFRLLTELWWIDNSTEYNNMNSLICFLKFCPSIQRLFITTDPHSYSSPSPSVGDHQKSIKVNNRHLRDLKVVILEGVTDEKGCIFFKDKLRELFYVEPLVLEVSRGMCTRCLIRTTKRATLDNLRKSNKLKFSYKFVEETDKDIKDTRYMHPHMT